MIELEIVRRMVRRGLLLAPVAIVGLWIAGGPPYGVSVAAGIALTLFNLWLAGRIIGGLAENRPDLLLAGGMAALGAGMILVVAGLVALRAIEFIDLPVAGLSLIGAHLVIVLWEAVDVFVKITPDHESTAGVARTRSRIHGI